MKTRKRFIRKKEKQWKIKKNVNAEFSSLMERLMINAFFFCFLAYYFFLQYMEMLFV